MNGFLIPANSKKSMLIFGLFNGFDLIVLAIGIVITIILLYASLKYCNLFSLAKFSI